MGIVESDKLPAFYDRLEQEYRVSIPCSRDNPELRWVYDTEIVSNLIAVIVPVLWHFLAQEGQHCGAELPEGGVAFVVGDMPVHQPP